MREIIEINDEYLDETLRNENLKVVSAMQIISKGQTVGNITLQDLREFNSQSFSTQAKKGEQLVSMMLAIQKVFDLMCDDIVELSTENEILKNQIGDYNEKWVEKSKTKLQTDG